MGRAKRHHLVARGYQRHWADKDRLQYVQKDTMTSKTVGTRDAFVIPNLLTIASEEGPSAVVESAFGQVESDSLPHVRRFVRGDRDSKAQLAVKALTALHWSRSLVVTKSMQAIAASVASELIASVEDDVRLREVFVREKGRQPEPGELAEIARERVDDWDVDNSYFAQRILDHYNTALEYLSSLHLQRVTAVNAGVSFVFADSPVIAAKRQNVGLRRAALFEADTWWFPLDPLVGVSFGTQPMDDLIAQPHLCQTLNMESWRWADRFVGAQQGIDLNRCLLFARGARIGS